MEVSVNYLKRHKRPVGDFLRLCERGGKGE